MARETPFCSTLPTKPASWSALERPRALSHMLTSTSKGLDAVSKIGSMEIPKAANLQNAKGIKRNFGDQLRMQSFKCTQNFGSEFL